MAFNWRKFPWTNLHDLNLDWIIQTVKTLEENLADAVSTFREMIDTAISNTLTGSGDLTINKTGDVNITGNRVIMTGNGGHTQMIGGAFISDTSEQLTLHNPNSNTNMTANYNNGVLRLTNNQNLEAGGVAVYHINTPADGGGDNSTFAANVGYVKGAVNTVSEQLTAESEARAAQDEHLQGGIDVVMNLVTALQKRATRVFYFENDTTTNTTQSMTAADTAALKDALVSHTPIMLIATTQGTQYCYLPVNCAPVPTADNINDPNTDFTYTFQSVNNLYRAMVSYSSSGNSIAVFQTIS